MMPVKKYMIPVYAVLVKSGEWLIDPIESEEKAVPENYRVPVAEYLALQK